MGESLPVVLSECLDALIEGEANKRQCLDKYPEHRGIIVSLLDTATQLLYLPYVSPSEQFYKESRARILNHTRQVQRSDQRNKVQKKSYPVILARAPVFAMVLVLVAVFVLGGKQVAYAADSSLPGDSLYPVKTWLENSKITFSSDAEDVILHLEFAQNRLVEIEQLTALNRYEFISAAVTDFEQHTQSAYTSLALVEQDEPEKVPQITALVQEKTGANLDTLNGLLVSAPVESLATLQNALTVALQLSATAEEPVTLSPSAQQPPVNVVAPSGNPGNEETDEPENSATATATSTPDNEPGNSGNAGTPESTPDANSNGNNNGNSGENGNSGNNNGNGGENGNSGNNNGNGNGNGDPGNDDGNNGGGNDNGNNGGGNDNGNGNGNDK